MSKLSRFIKRTSLATRKWIWQMQHNRSRDTALVFILGVQRSGTTMLKSTLEQSLELDVYGEDSRAMQDWRLRERESVLNIVKRSRSRAVVVKPLTESHRALELMGYTPGSLVIWMYRRASDRANSAVAKFGSTNLEHLAAFATGLRLETWQAQGLTAASLALIKRFDYKIMSPHSAAGLFWYIRNSLFFDQNLDKSELVLPIAYEDLVANPEKISRGVCQFIGCRYTPSMTRDIHARSIGRKPSQLSEEIEAICQPMYEKLQEAQAARWRSLGLTD